MNPNGKNIWFPAKKYGWGWGFPCAWQGWVVIGLFMVLSTMTQGFLFTSKKHIGLYIASTTILIAALFITCLLKGEKPRWRWDND